MPRAVKISKIFRVLEKIGFKAVRQKGSHIFYQHPDGRTTLVPNHKEIRVKLLLKICKDTGLEKEDFLKLL